MSVVNKRAFAKNLLHNPVHDLNPLAEAMSTFAGTWLSPLVPLANHTMRATKVIGLVVFNVSE